MDPIGPCVKGFVKTWVNYAVFWSMPVNPPHLTSYRITKSNVQFVKSGHVANRIAGQGSAIPDTTQTLHAG